MSRDDRRRRFTLPAVAVCVLGLAAACGPDAGDGSAGAPSDTVRVAVAANFAGAHERLTARFRQTSGIAVRTSIGSTGQLYAQIRNGAPFDVFLAADTARPARLAVDGHAVADSRFTYARGQLVFYLHGTEGARGPDRPASAERLAEAITRDPEAPVAIANPETAPYGAAAVETLARLGLTDRVQDRLVRAENVAQAFSFVASGAASSGFVALSQVQDRAGTRFWVVPDALHTPIRQDAVLLTNAADDEAARRYIAFLRSEEARRLIESWGYATAGRRTPPGSD